MIKLHEKNMTRIKFVINYPKTVKKYFLSNFLEIEYDKNITKIPNSILFVPAVSSIITVAWATGVNIFVEELDETFLNSLKKVKTIFQRWYPQFSHSSDIYAKTVTHNKFGGDRYLLLFTGGIDSLTSFIRYRNRRPELVRVWGTDIPIYEDYLLRKDKERIISFATREGVDVNFIKTNVQLLFNYYSLYKDFKISDWWGSVSHGLTLLGLTAPLTVLKKIKTVIIASTHTKDFKEPWGSHPLIDSNIRWADVRVVHDGYELSRHEKIRYYIVRHQQYLPYLKVCNYSRRNYNCGYCEKCLRTIIALLLEGIDPKYIRSAFDVKINEDFFNYVKNCFLKGKIHMGKDETFMWTDIQKHIPESIQTDMQALEEFFVWLKGFNLSEYKMRKMENFLWELSLILFKKESFREIIRRLPRAVIQILKKRLLYYIL